MSGYYNPTIEDILEDQDKKPISKLNANMTVSHLRNNKLSLKGLHGSIREQALTHNDTIRILLAKKKLTNDKRRAAKKIIKKYVGSTNLNEIAKYIESHASQENTNHSSVIIPDGQQQESSQQQSATPVPPTSPNNSTYDATNNKGDNQ